MGLETAPFLNDLVTTNPVGASDGIAQGDDHIRMMKAALKATFPGMAGAAWRVQSKGAGYTLAATDNMSVIYGTADLTLALTAAATLGNKFLCIVHADTGTITIDPNGAETVNGAATLAITVGQSCFLFCTGTAWVAMVITPPASLTASALLALLLTVDGAGSGLDADTLDGLSSAAFALVGHTHADMSAAAILAALLTVDGAGSGLDADTLDGQSSAYYATAASVTAKLGVDIGALGVGMMALCAVAGSIASGNTTAGSNIQVTYAYGSNPFSHSGVTPSGTWRNISGVTTTPFDAMTPQYYLYVFQRIA